MTLKDFYAAADGNYDDVMEVLFKEDRIKKYLGKFLDSMMPKKIKAALDSEDYETAFRESHNLKGMCMNMSLTKLRNLSSDLTESLRNGPTGDVAGLFALVDAEYARVCGLISQID